MDYRFIYMTAGSTAAAKQLARVLVEERLAACANVLPGAASIYWWQGTLEEAEEAVIIAKTRADLVDTLTERVKALHSYSCPCVVALPILAGNAAYLDWIGAETRGG